MKHCERILGVEGGGTKTAWALVETVLGVGDPGWEFRILEQGKLQASSFASPRPSVCARSLPNCRSKSIALEFSLQVAEQPKTVTRSGKSALRSGRKRKS